MHDDPYFSDGVCVSCKQRGASTGGLCGFCKMRMEEDRMRIKALRVSIFVILMLLSAFGVAVLFWQ